MADDPVDLVVRRASALPLADVGDLVRACRAGTAALASLRHSASSAIIRDACGVVEAATATASLSELGGVLDGVRRIRQRMPEPTTVVWTGPNAGSGTHRLTAAVVAELVDEAAESVLLVSYAMHTEKRLSAALERAAARHVEVTLLAERSVDNVHFGESGLAFPGLRATRLAWPAAHREPGASLHAKVLVVDSDLALVGSANITQSAMERNLECGLLVRDKDVVTALLAHVDNLRMLKHLVPAA